MTVLGYLTAVTWP